MFARNLAAPLVDALCWELKSGCAPSDLAKEIGVTTERLLTASLGLGCTVRSRPSFSEWAFRRWKLEPTAETWAWWNDFEAGRGTRDDELRIERAEIDARAEINRRINAAIDAEELPPPSEQRSTPRLTLVTCGSTRTP